MKTRVLLTIVLTLISFLTAPYAFSGTKAKASTNMKEAPPTQFQYRAVSLRVLQERLRTYQKQEAYSRELHYLVGLTKITGYVLDEASHDLILVGQVDEGLPQFHLEDLVIALRNAWLKYAILRGNTYYYSDPGCSIDPDDRVMKRLQAIGQKILGDSSPDMIKMGIKEWQDTCQSPQTVRVLGIPFDTHFAWVMVKADYDMKRLVDGSDSSTIQGFSSLTDVTLERAKDDILHGRALSIPVSSMNRFWFYPGENTYEEDQGVVAIKRCQVILLTEEEYLDRRGDIVGKGRASPLAQQFAHRFTVYYNEVAKRRPIYSELANLFRFVALAKIIKLKSPHAQAGVDLAYLLNHHPVPSTSVSRQLPGRSHVKHFTHRRDFTGGYEIAQLWLPSCGGVGINIDISHANFARDTSGRLAELRAAVVRARPSADALYWDFPLRWRVGLDE